MKYGVVYRLGKSHYELNRLKNVNPAWDDIGDTLLTNASG
jgi:hypothetical protein